MIELRGITWDHPRGLAPLVATAHVLQLADPSLSIRWEARSLHAFGAQPLSALAGEFDLLVLDHPFVGTVALEQSLLPLETVLPAPFLTEQATDSVGQSHASYRYGGHQWALAIDAATQVSAYRPDLLAALGCSPPCSWPEVLQFAQTFPTRLALPLTPVNAISCFLTLCAARGETPMAANDHVVSRQQGSDALHWLIGLLRAAHPASLQLDPPTALEQLSASDSIAFIPLVFGYSNYSRPNQQGHPCRFGPPPVMPPCSRPRGSLLGGAGLAISARCQHVEAAVRFARLAADPTWQRTGYVLAGGQPGNRQAWVDPLVNAATGGFFSATLEAHELAYLRPRYPGYPAFQDELGHLLHRFLREGGEPDELLDRFDWLYRSSLERTGGAPAS